MSWGGEEEGGLLPANRTLNYRAKVEREREFIEPRWLLLLRTELVMCLLYCKTCQEMWDTFRHTIAHSRYRTRHLCCCSSVLQPWHDLLQSSSPPELWRFSENGKEFFQFRSDSLLGYAWKGWQIVVRGDNQISTWAHVMPFFTIRFDGFLPQMVIQLLTDSQHLISSTSQHVSRTFWIFSNKPSLLLSSFQRFIWLGGLPALLS